MKKNEEISSSSLLISLQLISFSSFFFVASNTKSSLNSIGKFLTKCRFVILLKEIHRFPPKTALVNANLFCPMKKRKCLFCDEAIIFPFNAAASGIFLLFFSSCSLKGNPNWILPNKNESFFSSENIDFF